MVYCLRCDIFEGKIGNVIYDISGKNFSAGTRRAQREDYSFHFLVSSRKMKNYKDLGFP